MGKYAGRPVTQVVGVLGEVPDGRIHVYDPLMYWNYHSFVL